MTLPANCNTVDEIRKHIREHYTLSSVSEICSEFNVQIGTYVCRNDHIQHIATQLHARIHSQSVNEQISAQRAQTTPSESHGSGGQLLQECHQRELLEQRIHMQNLLWHKLHAEMQKVQLENDVKQREEMQKLIHEMQNLIGNKLIEEMQKLQLEKDSLDQLRAEIQRDKDQIVNSIKQLRMEMQLERDQLTASLNQLRQDMASTNTPNKRPRIDASFINGIDFSANFTTLKKQITLNKKIKDYVEQHCERVCGKTFQNLRAEDLSKLRALLLDSIEGPSQ